MKTLSTKTRTRTEKIDGTSPFKTYSAPEREIQNHELRY